MTWQCDIVLFWEKGFEEEEVGVMHETLMWISSISHCQKQLRANKNKNPGFGTFSLSWITKAKAKENFWDAKLFRKGGLLRMVS